MQNIYDSIIFDLDGTLWNASQNICNSWNVVLKRHPEIKRDNFSLKELQNCFGLPMYDIAAKLFPQEEVNKRNSLMDELCLYENEYLEKNGGELYPQLEEVLLELGKKYSLFIVSNCQSGYIESFLKAHHLEKYFKDFECWGRTKLSKGESNKILIKRNNLKHPIYVGDTDGDAQSAIDAGIDFIFASYGFGEVKKERYKQKIEKFSDLKSLLI